MKRFATIAFILALALSINTEFVLAGTTGKIAGKIYDKDTKEALPGANIVLEGTTLGASADGKGNYYIIQIPPGTYSVRVTMLGYQTIVEKNVKVSADLTTRLDFALTSTVLEVSKEVVVVAERPLIQPDVTASMRIVAKEEIKNIPDMRRFQDVVALQPGAVSRGGIIYVRGGRRDEVMYMVDGIPMKDLYTGMPALQVSTAAIEEITMITSGFNAEYGEAQSGVINIVTRSGSSRFSGRLHYKTDDFGLKKPSFNSDYVSFSLGGPEPMTSKLLPTLGVNIPGDITFFYAGDVWMTDTFTPWREQLPRHRFRFLGLPLFKYTDRPETQFTQDIKLTYSPTSEVKVTYGYRKSWERLNRYDHYWKNLPDSTQDERNTTDHHSFQLTHTLSKSTFYTLNLGRVRRLYHNDFNGRNPTQYNPVWWSDSWPGDGLADQGGAQLWWDRDFKDWTAKFDLTSQVLPQHLVKFGLEFHRDDLFNIDLQYPTTFLRETFTDLNGNGVWDPDEPFQDKNLNGRYDTGIESFTDLDGDGVWDPYEPFSDENANFRWDPGEWYTDANRNGLWDPGEPFVDRNTNRQYDPGLVIGPYAPERAERLNDLNGNGVWDPGEPFEDHGYDATPGTGDEGEGNGHWDSRAPGPFPQYAFYRWYSNVKDRRASAYLQDKIEFEGMIVNMGVRFDYFYPGKEVQDSLYIQAWKDATGLPWKGAKAKTYWQPRLGISYPVSEKTTAYFNYGRFLQLPEFQYFFRDPFAARAWVGNPNLKPQKTVQYEFGFSQQFTEDIVLDFKGFYKDIRDYATLAQAGRPGNVLWVWDNADYATAKGIEARLKKRYSRYTAADVTYTFQVVKGRSSSAFTAYYRPDLITSREVPLDWDQRHKVTAIVDLRIPRGEHLKVFGIPLPDDMGLNILWKYGSGFPYTPPGRNTTLLVNSKHADYSSTVDVKLDKQLTYKAMTFGAFLEVLNLLDRRNPIRDWGFNSLTGKPNTYGDTTTEEDPAKRRIYNWWETQGRLDARRYGAPRQIFLGLEILW